MACGGSGRGAVELRDLRAETCRSRLAAVDCVRRGDARERLERRVRRRRADAATIRRDGVEGQREGCSLNSVFRRHFDHELRSMLRYERKKHILCVQGSSDPYEAFPCALPEH